VRNRWKTGLLALVLGSLSMAAVAQDPATMDKELEGRRQEVADELDKLPRFPGPFDHVTFTVSGTVVTLGGFATSPSLKADAQKVVERLEWVTGVENEIEFHQSEPAANQIREETLAVLVDALPDAFAERFPDLRIKVDPALNVTIVGTLSPINRGRLESALVRIDQLALVKSVDNQVQFKKEK